MVRARGAAERACGWSARALRGREQQQRRRRQPLQRTHSSMCRQQNKFCVANLKLCTDGTASSSLGRAQRAAAGAAHAASSGISTAASQQPTAWARAANRLRICAKNSRGPGTGTLLRYLNSNSKRKLLHKVPVKSQLISCSRLLPSCVPLSRGRSITARSNVSSPSAVLPSADSPCPIV